MGSQSYTSLLGKTSHRVCVAGTDTWIRILEPTRAPPVLVVKLPRLLQLSPWQTLSLLRSFFLGTTPRLGCRESVLSWLDGFWEEDCPGRAGWLVL